ncbi:MAG: tetrahydrofolate dehydrogenase/cyclohydrolase catalytic domain-containing protein [bacterium]|nr:tetrahydrofolate dehydrogenase/cyclohydrolase catalytic domain-containing protein [bacterium]
MQILYGHAVVKGVIDYLRASPKRNKQLAIIVPVNDDAASDGFVAEVNNFASNLAISTRTLFKTINATTEELIADLDRLSADKDVGGVVLVLPLPKNIDREKVLLAIPIRKDVDVLNPGNKVSEPPAVRTVSEIWKEFNDGYHPRNGPPKKVAVVGRGLLIGAPIAKYLRMWGHSVEVYNSKTSLDGLRDADVVILGAGVPKLVSPSILKAGAHVIDFGYPGDFDSKHPEAGKVGIYVPARGGTGTILTVSMFYNFYLLNSW